MGGGPIIICILKTTLSIQKIQNLKISLLQPLNVKVKIENGEFVSRDEPTPK